MSRFNFSIIAIVCACCLFTVACEKEEFTPTSTNTAPEFSVDHTVPSSPGFTGKGANIQAADMLLRLREAPVFADATTYVDVTTERPTHPKFRYLDTSPAPTTSREIDCPYGDCEDKVPAMVARYQEIATAQCNDQFLSITCCADGETVYLVIYIEADCLTARSR